MDSVAFRSDCGGEHGHVDQKLHYPHMTIDECCMRQDNDRAFDRCCSSPFTLMGVYETINGKHNYWACSCTLECPVYPSAPGEKPYADCVAQDQPAHPRNLT